MYLNPIVKKEVKVQSRSMKLCLSLLGYELILTLVSFFVMFLIDAESRYSDTNVYSQLTNLYPVLGVAQIIILGIIVPVQTASAISGEKERQTFDIMMTTSMTPFSVIMGKVMTAVMESMFFVAGSLPIMSLVFVIGGMSWAYLFWFFGVAMLATIFAASIGIFCSAVCRKTISAVIMTYAWYILFFVGTFAPAYLVAIAWGVMTSRTGPSNADWIMNLFTLLLVNPAVYLAEFFTRVSTGRGIISELGDGISNQGFNIISLLSNGYWWLIVSTIMLLLVSLLFLWVASRIINPMKKRK